MRNVILVHANCRNPKAKGDFSFAGNIAKDLVNEIDPLPIDVILVSTRDGISRFESLYGSAVNGRVCIEGKSIGLSALEQFDAIENTVVAFIDANYCKRPGSDIVKRVLSPETKFLFVGNVNQESYSTMTLKYAFLWNTMQKQPNLYEFFEGEDKLIASAGFGSDRLGLPTITKAKDLPDLNSSQEAMIPGDEYGFVYASIEEDGVYELIAQYFKLTQHQRYILVGLDADKEDKIKCAYESDLSLAIPTNNFPNIQCYQSLPNVVMRKLVMGTTGSLVLTTGVTSTLEAMQDGKLTYYQDAVRNITFVNTYLMTLRAIIASDTTLAGSISRMLLELSYLLFACKPLNSMEIERTQELLNMPHIQPRLIAANQTILEQAGGKIAPNLLLFITQSRSTQSQTQLASVCASLRTQGEVSSPVYDEALRRAAAWGLLFELKVLIKASKDLNKESQSCGFTALHWAVHGNHLDCARVLINAGASLDIPDNKGQTPLDKAISKGYEPLIELLTKAGAPLHVADKNSKCPGDDASKNEKVTFFKRCYAQISSSVDEWCTRKKLYIPLT